MDNVNGADVQAPKNPTQLKANFGLLKFILLSALTFGIYSIYSYSKVGDTLNIVVGRYDGKKTMSF